jgi:hypothetical protein
VLRHVVLARLCQDVVGTEVVHLRIQAPLWLW